MGVTKALLKFVTDFSAENGEFLGNIDKNPVLGIEAKRLLSSLWLSEIVH